MIVALKGNRETKITNEEEKQHYLSLGYKIIDLDAPKVGTPKQEAPKSSRKEAKKAKVVEVTEEVA